MNLADLEATVTTIKEQGPNRVLINRDGEAVRPSKFTGFVDFILIRDDGWSLACRRDLLDVAFRLWHDQTHPGTDSKGQRRIRSMEGTQQI